VRDKWNKINKYELYLIGDKLKYYRVIWDKLYEINNYDECESRDKLSRVINVFILLTFVWNWNSFLSKISYILISKL